MKADIVLSCEHAGNNIPEQYRHLFRDAESGVLASHRGWDPGAWEMATGLADRLGAPLFGCHTSRLLIEVNRSLHHAELFSEFTAGLGAGDKERLVREIYRPYREQVRERIARSAGPVIHLSLHSFTPVLHGSIRAVEIGLLFDPARDLEVACCDFLKTVLVQSLPSTRVAFNEPYRGIDDGFTTSLREIFPSGRYAGIEVEVNQNLVGTGVWQNAIESLSNAVTGLRDLPPDP